MIPGAYCYTHPNGYSYVDEPSVVIHGQYVGPDHEDRIICSVWVGANAFSFHDTKMLRRPDGTPYIRIRSKFFGYDIRMPLKGKTYGVHDYRDTTERKMSMMRRISRERT